MKNLIRLLMLSCCYLLACQEDREIPGKTPEALGALKGRILNSASQPVFNAKVSLQGVSQAITYSDSNGFYQLLDIPVGTYTVNVQQESYQSYQASITIAENVFSIHDVSLQSDQDQLHLSDSVISALAVSGDTTVSITANAEWKIHHTHSWLNVSVSEGTGNATVAVSWQENVSEAKRTDTLYIETSTLRKVLVIDQDYPLRLIHQEGIVRSNPDSALLIFNKPLTSIQVSSNTDHCLSTITVDKVLNDYGVRFTYGCARMGMDYSFRISAKDSSGNMYVENIIVPFFTRRVEIDGYITDYFIEGNSAYFATINPHRIIQYSVNENRILKEFDLSTIVAPLDITLNPYNEHLYVSGASTNTVSTHHYHRLTSLYVFDSQYGKLIKEIPITPDESDHPQSPTIVPYDVGFTDNGYGILLLQSNGSSATRWKVIESALGDSIYVHQDRGGNFSQVMSVFNHSKLLLKLEYNSSHVTLVDGDMHELSTVSPFSSNLELNVIPHRKKDVVFLGRYTDQFFMDGQSTFTALPSLTCTSENGDFSYREGEENIMYFCNENNLGSDNFYVCDFTTGNIILQTPLRYGLKQLNVTDDGNYALGYVYAGGNTDLLIFDTQLFYPATD